MKHLPTLYTAGWLLAGTILLTSRAAGGVSQIVVDPSGLPPYIREYGFPGLALYLLWRIFVGQLAENTRVLRDLQATIARLDGRLDPPKGSD